MTSWLYAGLYSVLMFVWPAFLVEKVQGGQLAMVAVLNSALALFVIYQCSSIELSFFRGLDIIAGSSMSGCANITLIYLPQLLTVVYLIAIFHCIISLFRGREYSQERWIGLVEGFYWRGMGTPLNPMARVSASHAVDKPIDPEDPQSLLEAGSYWEMEGEWDKAIALFKLASEKLRGYPEGVYAENCIKRIQEKIERVKGNWE